MGFLIEYNNCRYLLVELMGSAAKHRILPAIRVERKDQNTGMTLIWLGLTATYIYIYIYRLIKFNNSLIKNYVPFIQDLARKHWIAQ